MFKMSITSFVTYVLVMIGLLSLIKLGWDNLDPIPNVNEENELLCDYCYNQVDRLNEKEVNGMKLNLCDKCYSKIN